RAALVEGDWDGKLPFFVHNRKLIAEIEKLEHKIRRPDLLIHAGDLAHCAAGEWKPALDELARAFPGVPLHLLPGNHDYCGGTLEDGMLALTAAAQGAAFAQKSVILTGGARILTCTLWTDFAMWGEDARDQAMERATWIMPEYAAVQHPQTGDLIRPADLVAMHRDHLNWLEKQLAEDFDGPTIVVTHHCPHPSAAGPADLVSAAFASDLSETIQRFQPAAWLFGHTHRPLSAQVGRTLVHNVSLGYPDEAGDDIAARLSRGLIEIGDDGSVRVGGIACGQDAESLGV
ncbi:MAG TPA: DUF3418 domain-containing protein, partial [Paracoccus sp. (in: a-proteobacteria)]|nr:DUF3418 domain-containing protein [Paracoccus sp. (in: a-proteobacteria)]